MEARELLKMDKLAWYLGLARAAVGPYLGGTLGTRTKAATILCICGQRAMLPGQSAENICAADAQEVLQAHVLKLKSPGVITRLQFLLFFLSH
jgi:hypothetical protein